MSGRVFQPQRRLATLLRRPGGVSIEVALARAADRVEGTREECLSVIDTRIEELCTIAERMTQRDLRHGLVAAGEVFALSGMFELNELSAAAESLSGVIEHVVALSEAGEGWELDAQPDAVKNLLWRAVRVHAETLRTLRRPDLAAHAEARMAVVQGLRQVVERAKTALDNTQHQDGH